MPMHALKGETYQTKSPLRMAILPMVGHTFFRAETEFLMFRQFARDMRDWYGAFSYIMIPESAKDQIRQEPGMRIIFEGPFECFHDGVVSTPANFLELFNPRDGRYPVDVVITSRGASGAVLQRALRDYRGDVVPLAISEPFDDVIPLVLDESMPTDFGWKANPSIDWSELMARVVSYATAPMTLFDTERERQVALSSARRILSAQLLKNLESKMEAAPYGFSTEFVDECIKGVDKRNKLTLFMGQRHNCLVAGSRVIRNGVPIPIEDIRPDDRVKADHETTKVLDTHQYASTKLIRVKATYLLPITCTPDHRIMVTPYEIRTTYKRIRKGIFEDFRSSQIFESADWMTAEEIEHKHTERKRGTQYRRAGMMVHYPFDETEVDDPEISDDLCELIGWYVAEGSCPVSRCNGRRYQVSFALSSRERDVAERLLDISKRLFDANGSIREKKGNTFTIKGRKAVFSDGGIEVVICSRKMAELISSMVPGKATTKALSEKIMLLPKRKQQILLSGEVLGDGYAMGVKTRSGNQFYYDDYRTASHDLAVQLQLLLLRQGRISSVYFREGMYSVRDQTGNRQHGFIEDGVLYCPIKSVAHEDGPRQVYDLTTERGNYVTESGLVHNCDKRWDKIVDIYNRFYSYGRDVGIVITAPKLENVSALPIVQSNKAIDVTFECEQPEFLRKAAECHISLWMSKVEGLAVGLLQQMYIGLICILPKLPWVKEILKDRYDSYPFLYKTPKQSEKVLRHVAENYEEAKSKVSWVRQWVKDTYDTRKCSRYVYEKIRDKLVLLKSPCRLWTKSNVELFLAVKEALPDKFTFQEAVDMCYSKSQQLYKHMRDPRRGKASRWSLWKWLKGPGGFIDNCKAEQPVFTKDPNHEPGPYSDIQYFKYREERVCPKCGGRGFLDKARETETRCPVCGGSGEMGQVLED